MTPDQLAQLLDELGKRLGPSGEYVFRIAVQRVVISSVVWAAIAGGYLVAFGLYLWAVVRSYRGFTPKVDGYLSSQWVDDLGFPLVLGAIIGGLVGALMVGVLGSSVVSLLTPEYSALRDILSAIGGAK